MSEEPARSPADPGLALCLSSSFFGYYAHLGLLSAMEKRGLRPGRIAGASAGALAGGFWAAGLRGEALARVIYDFHFLRSFFDLGAFLPRLAFFERFPAEEIDEVAASARVPLPTPARRPALVSPPLIWRSGSKAIAFRPPARSRCSAWAAWSPAVAVGKSRL